MKETSTITKNQFSRYFLVGIMNFFIDFSLFNLLVLFLGINASIYYIMFRIISVSAATTNSFFWNKSWVFKKKNAASKAKKEMLLFFLVAFFGIGINVIFSTTFFVLLKNLLPHLPIAVYANISALIGITVSVFWNFFGYKYIVFKK